MERSHLEKLQSLVEGDPEAFGFACIYARNDIIMALAELDAVRMQHSMEMAYIQSQIQRHVQSEHNQDKIIRELQNANGILRAEVKELKKQLPPKPKPVDASNTYSGLHDVTPVWRVTYVGFSGTAHGYFESEHGALDSIERCNVDNFDREPSHRVKADTIPKRMLRKDVPKGEMIAQ